MVEPTKEELFSIYQKSSIFTWFDDYYAHYREVGDDRIITITCKKEIVGYFWFISRLNGKIWQLIDYNIDDINIIDNILKKIKYLDKKLQCESNSRFAHMWEEIIPTLGYQPMILNFKSQELYDPILYHEETQQFSNCWVLDLTSNYYGNCLWYPNKLLLPYTGLWYIFDE